RARVAAEASRLSVFAVVSESVDPEAALRFATIDAERFPSAAEWVEKDVSAPGAETAMPGGVAHAERPGGGLLRPMPSRPVRLRIDAERRPGVDALLASLEASARDPSVAAHVLDPWPRRTVHADAS